MKRSVAIWVALLGLVCSLWVSSALGQAVYGSILGTVTDPSGAAVNGAKVTVTSQTKNVSTDVTTNESGNYSATHLIPDVYMIRIAGTGFKTLEYKDIQVSADTAAHIDGQFQVGSASEQVEVTAEAPQLKTDRADVSIEFSAKMVEDAPILNRNFTSFELLSPGTQKLVGWSHAATENPQGGQQIFVNGQHFSGTAFELDGTDNQDPILGIIVVNPNLDAVQEAKVTLGNYDAEFGKAVAGVVTVQTKSGSNDFHGSGFWFRRTDALAARDPFTQYQPDAVTGRLIPSSRWQQFGATIGGPIIKNKLFFFGDFQATRQKNGISNQETIPTLTAEQSCNPATNGSSSTPGFCNLVDYGQIMTNNGAPFIFVPTGDSAGARSNVFCGSLGIVAQGGCSGTTAGVSNQFLIPIGMLSTAATNMLAAFPNPTSSGTCQIGAANSSGCENNFVGAGAGPYNQNSFDTRIDYAASQSVSVFGRFSFNHFSLSGAPSLGAVGGIGFGPGGLAGSSIVHNYSLATGVTKTFSSTLLGDFRFGYFQYNPLTNKPDAGTAAMTNFGIPNANMGDNFTSGLGEFDMVNGSGNNTSTNLSNFGDGLGVARCNCPLIERERQYQFVGNITKIMGNHQFKFGADVRFATNLRVPSDSNRTGVYQFSSGDTANSGSGGLDLATFLLGDVTQLSRYVSTSVNAAERQHRMFYYGQDTWRVTPKLTVNYGLRWEVYFPEYVNGKDNGGFANIVQGVDRVAGEAGIGLNGNIDNKWSYFAPRLGFAYQVNQKTVVRMGYGRSYDMGVFGSNFGHAVTQNLPVLASQLVQPATAFRESPFTLDQGPPIFTFPAIPSNGLFPVAGPQCYQSSTLPASSGGGPSGQSCTQPHIRPTYQRLPTLDAWNVTLQRQLDRSTSIEVAYVGNKGTNTFMGDGPTYNVNPVAIGPGTAKVAFDPVVCNGIVNTGCTTPSFSANVPQVQRRPLYNAFTYTGYPDPTNVAIAGVPSIVPGTLQCCSTDQGNYLGNNADSIYNALQIKVDRRLSQGLQLLSHYTFAHAMAYNNGYYADNHAYAYGPDDEVRNHVWVTSLVYELPFGKGKSFMGDSGRLADLFIGGWQISGTTNWSGGLPWTPSFSNCNQVNDVGTCEPVKNGSFHLGAGSFQHPAGQHPFVTFFTPIPTLSYPDPTTLGPNVDTCTLTRPSGQGWAMPACGALGNAGLFSLRGPRAFFADSAAFKNFSITERVKAQFRMDVFNLFNHPVLGFSGNQGGTGQCIDCSGNGQITDIEADASPGSTTGMRQIEFALKFSF
ncbi:MAG TPA: TonB-dependent receptor [Candidatus Sulfotelmatobacter sp.]|jgi:outer membrane receptor protein involved in Fe transport